MSTVTMATRASPAWVRRILVATLAFGVALHSIALMKGRAWLLANVLTPPVDLALTIPMAFSAWGLWQLRSVAQHPRRGHGTAYLTVCVYMAISALVHLDTLLAWEVRYVDRFPNWYSLFIIPVQAAMLFFASRLRFEPHG